MRSQKKKRICSLLLSFAMIICVTLISAAVVNATEVTKDGLLLEIVSDKESYTMNDKIELNFKVTNTNEKDIENVRLNATLPDALDTKDQKSADTAILKAGEAMELHVNALAKPANDDTPSTTHPTESDESTGDTPSSETNNGNSTSSGSSSGTTNKSGTDNSAVQTGQSSLVLAVCLIAMLAALAAVWFFKTNGETNNKINIKKSISIILCLSVLSGSLLITGIPAFAKEITASTETLTLSKEIEVGGTKLTVGAKVDYDKKDETSDENITKLSDDMYITKPQAEHVRYDVEAGIPYVDNEILVTFKLNVDENAINEFVSSLGGKIIGKIAPTNTYQIEIQVCEEFAEADAIITQIEASELVDFASPDILMIQALDAYYPHSDTEWKDEWSTFPNGDNWGVEAIKSPGAWEYVDYMQNVNVGISDNQFYDHDDLHFESTYFNTVDGSIKSPSHGTHVAGTIGAGFNNRKGVTGVTPKAKLYGWNWNKSGTLYKANHSDWIIDTDNIDYNVTSSGSECLMLTQLLAISKCRVINYSAGFGDSGLIYAASRDYSTARRYVNALSDVVEKYLSVLIDNPNVPEFIIVTAAGNENNDYFIHDSKGYHKSESFIDDITADKGNILAKYASPYNNIESRKIKDKIIVVGAVENKTKNGVESYSLCEFSNIGNRVDVVAPGKDIESTVNNNGYDKMQGTSMAAPHVTGIAAMLYSLNPDIKADEVKRIICETADREVDGYKLVNAEAAVKAVMGTGTIGGKVVSASDGSALSDVKITAYQKLKSGRFPIEFNTSDQGGFSKELISGKYEFDFKKDGYEPLSMDITIDKDVITVLKDTIELHPKSAPTVNLVEDAMRGTYKVYGDTRQEFAIPKINLDSEDAKNANRKILDDYIDCFKDNNGEGLWSLDYSYAVDGNTLSVLITAKYVDNNYKSYSAYNFDIADGKLLNGAELLSRYNFSESNAVVSVQNDIIRRYNEQGGIDESVVQRYRQKALDQNKNTSNMQFYVDNSKKVNIIYYATWVAGAEGYYYNIPISKDSPIDTPSDNNQYTALELWPMQDYEIFSLLKDKNISISTMDYAGTSYALVFGSELPGFYFGIQNGSNVTKDNYKNAPIAFIYMTEPAVFSSKQDSTYGDVAIGMSINDLPNKFKQNMSKISDGVYMVSLFNGASMARLQFNSNNKLESMLIVRHL